MIVLGLDPGYDGAGVALDKNAAIVYTFKYDLYVNGRRMYDVQKMAEHFQEVRSLSRKGKDKQLITVIEDQHRWPKLMMGFGVLWTLAKLYSDDVILVAPRSWQSYYKITGKRKNEHASREVAEEMFGLDTNDHNVAEAALIALWALNTKID